MSSTGVPTWSFLTNHAAVLLCIARDPSIRLRDIGDRVGITERAAHRIVDELVAAGYVSRERTGRRNHYTIHRDLPLHDRIAHEQKLGELLAILTTKDAAQSAAPGDAVGPATLTQLGGASGGQSTPGPSLARDATGRDTELRPSKL